MSTSPTLETAQAVLAAQPFSVALGTELTRYDEDVTCLELAVCPQLLQQHGYVHGGVLAYLADNALTFAGGRVLGPEILTAGVQLSYLRPARGDRLIARASVQGRTSRTVVSQVAISVRRDDEEHLCAVGTGTVSAINR